MGGGESYEVVSPWTPFDEDAQTFNEEEIEEIKSTILDLTKSADVFLNKNKDSKLLPGFLKIESTGARIEGAIEADPRVAVWINKLVPKLVSEEDFWLNYFSHVSQAFILFSQKEESKPSTEPSWENVNIPETTAAALTAAGKEVQFKDGKEAQETSEKPEEAEKPEEVEKPDEEEKLSTPTDISPDAEDVPQDVPEPGEVSEGSVEIQRFPDFDKLDSFLFDDYPDPFKPSTEDLSNQSDLGGVVRWGIVGCGKVCEIKAGPAFTRAIGSELVAVMRRDAKKAEDFAKRHGVKKFYTSAYDLINDPEVTAVYVATPPGSHKEYAIMAARAGKPCLVEKPLARSYSEGQQIVEEFENRSVPLYVAYYRRGLPRFIRARQIVTKHLGNVTSITYTYLRQQHLPQTGWDLGWRIEPEQSGGGIFMDLGCHVLDILDFLFGPLDRVSGSAVQEANAHPKGLKVPTCIAAQFRTRTKALGTVMFNFASPKDMDRLTIVGTEGTLQMSVFGHEAPLFARPKLLPSGKITSVLRQVNCPVQDTNVHRSLVQNIVNELRRVSSAVVISSGKSALRTARIMDIILTDFYKGRSDDFWKRPETFGDS